MALRRALHEVSDLGLSPDERGTVELVLAEVLNNICEHALRGATEGLIELYLRRDCAGLICEVLDDGLPMPGGHPPEGQRADLDRPLPDLPEGGFGWFLISELTSGLCYDRIGGRNRLRFCVRVGAPGVASA